MYLTVPEFYIYVTALEFYLLMIRPVVNTYLTPWIDVLLKNSSQVTASGLFAEKDILL